MGLHLQEIGHRYGSQVSLRGVSLHLEPGDCYGFIGHNGAGKTTTLRIALGLMRPRAGRVVVDGFEAARFPREARARMGGLVEVPGFYGHVSGFDNLVELGRLQGMTRIAARAAAGHQLDRVGLGFVGHRRVRTYSQGMRQRLGLAQAMLGDPRYVLLDEPLSNLDPEGIAELRDVLRRLAREAGVAVLISSHQLHEVAGLCNRVGLLREGVMLLEEDTAELLGAARGRYQLATDRDAAARRVVDELGIPREDRDGEGMLLSLGGSGTGPLVRALVAADVELRVLAPRPTTLEEVYLRAGREPAREVGGGAAAADGEPRPRRAPRLPVLRVFGFELRRLVRRPVLPLLALAPVVLAGARILRRRAAADRDLEQVAGGQLMDAVNVTGYEALGWGLHSGLFAVVLLVAGLASQSLAGDFSRGTLRHLLLRPVGRVQAAAGKALGQVTASLCAYGVLVLASWLAAAWWFEFEDLVYLGEMPERILDAADLGALVPGLLLYPLPPLLAYCGLGFLAGAISRRGVRALALALGAVLVLDQLRVLDGDLLPLLPSAYLPSPTGDHTSYLPYYLEANAGQLGAVFALRGTAVSVPLVWCVLSFALGALALQRRSIP